ncbi:transcription termination factor Rho [Candidatus Roizmanbacteria bacterium CG_4_9_14_0_8_um_filter_34_12]|uniref:Transcription termination factor Rho n=4 Tax=Candidatus Roizmaniibacteriota TaxID=1752723 RepID=A0A2H0C2Z3_9BACT|nr:transcription termination factor Rho [Candidatus Roizmanbacteria bacterium]PIP64282.1 MAG: transcription termination factor Rho [Candidatus Roizmanbacteria bacterium CG22_combo_CG10-13_8_21_14_all_33_16]PIX74429.1 MAG: transcription termination factor Rho [Candidatus Roizmanbacteria bacterium CG_4_10_14_3_um_filter_33_21]PJB88127.1 MAG: transcription termination factor Rho [Candidatus Roizmanbacteria bacterium CG_4_9_14_0_8_um_filter_34_12]
MVFFKKPIPAAKTTAATPTITNKPITKPLDVSTILDKYEEKPIITQNTVRHENTLEDRLKDDLKISYPAKGILDITLGGYGFLRQNYVIDPENDIYVSTSQIRRFWLRRADEVEGLARPPKQGERFHSLLLIKKINGEPLTEEQSRTRKDFEQLTSLHPNKQIKLETTPEVLSTRMVDLISPVGFGQRALIVSQPKAGKTTFLKEMVEAIATNYPKVLLMAILIGERPEEVTEIKRFIKGEAAASNFDESPRQQVKVANLALERARRLVEMGKDVVIFLDSVTRLARALNLSVNNTTGRSLSGGFDPSALYPAKKFLGAARNCEEGGSLTIIGTALIGTESRMDDLIYEELKGTGNLEIYLDRDIANRRIFPAIDVEKSGTRHDELLYEKAVLPKINTLRRMLSLLNTEERITKMIDRLTKTKSNAEFLESMNRGA